MNNIPAIIRYNKGWVNNYKIKVKYLQNKLDYHSVSICQYQNNSGISPDLLVNSRNIKFCTKFEVRLTY